MSTETAHLSLAQRNKATLDYLLEEGESHSEWVVTVAFYRALHIVEAVFSNDSGISHRHNHEERERALKQTKRYQNLYKHYRPLWAASMIARYLSSRGKTFRSFSDYLPASDVRSEIVNHHLKQIEKSAIKFLSSEGKELFSKTS